MRRHAGRDGRWIRGGLAALFAVSLGTGLAGCNLIKAATLLVAPTEEKVAPEYKDLPGKKVLIYVWAERDILWEYTKLRLDVSGWLAAYLEKHVKNVVVVDPVQVERYLEQQRVAEVDPVELGRHFQADAVIHLSLYQFSTRDPEMAHYYRGRAGASIHVYDLSRPGEPVETKLSEAKVTVPENEPIGLHNTTAAAVRQATYEAFTAEVGKRFHEWSREVN